MNWHKPGLYKDKCWKLRAALCASTWLSQRVGSITRGHYGQATDPLLELQPPHSLLYARVGLRSIWGHSGGPSQGAYIQGMELVRINDSSDKP